LKFGHKTLADLPSWVNEMVYLNINTKHGIFKRQVVKENEKPVLTLLLRGADSRVRTGPGLAVRRILCFESAEQYSWGVAGDVEKDQ
jgi:hypothetical protein